MKKLLLSLLITALFFLAPIEDTHGQLKEIEKFLDAGGDNVEALTKAYLSPLPNGVITNCVAHEDNNPSLSICQGTTQILVNCFSGCDRKDVLSYFYERIPQYKYDNSSVSFRNKRRYK